MSTRIKGFLVLTAVAGAVFLGSAMVATDYAAAHLPRGLRLGAPLIAPRGVPIYAPWAWSAWTERYASAAPRVCAVVRLIAGAGGVSAFGLLMLGISLLRGGRTSSAHGSARWATPGELKRAGLLESRGVVLCQTAEARYVRGTGWKMKRSGRLVRHDGPEHVFVFAPTRSGKGIGMVIPTLLSWNSSVLVYDIKKELWAATAGWRRQFSRCWRFEPTASDSVRFNPLLEIRRGDAEVKDTQNVADILVDPQGSAERRDHWQQTGHSLLVGAILHVLYAESDKSLTGVAAFLSDPLRPQLAILEHMLATNHTSAGPHPVVAQVAREMLNKSDNELSGVFSTAMACLGLYRDPVIARNTSCSDFRIADLMNLADPVSLYLVVPPSDIDRTRPLVRLMMNQIGRRLTERLSFQGTAYQHRLLMLLDEFPSLGRLSFFENELPYLAGYGIKCFLIAQSLNQIEKAYGPNNAILDNCHIRVTYNALDERTAKRISDLLGQSTLMKRQRSVSGGWLSRVSHSEHELGRPLMMPDEILRLPYDEALLMVGGLSPYRAKKIMYFLDLRFRARAGRRPPESMRARAAELPPRSEPDWPLVPLPTPLGPSAMAARAESELSDPPAGPGAAPVDAAPLEPPAAGEAWAAAFGTSSEPSGTPPPPASPPHEDDLADSEDALPQTEKGLPL